MPFPNLVFRWGQESCTVGCWVECGGPWCPVCPGDSSPQTQGEATSEDKQVVCAKTTNTTGRPCLRTEPRSSPQAAGCATQPVHLGAGDHRTTGHSQAQLPALIGPQRSRPTLGVPFTRNSMVPVVAAAAWGSPGRHADAGSRLRNSCSD